MTQTEKRRRVKGLGTLLRFLSDLGYAIPVLVGLASAAAAILLVVVEIVEPAALVVAAAVIITGLLLRYRATHRLKDRWYERMRGRLRRELRFTRYWIATGAAIAVIVATLPALPAMILSALLSLVLLLTGLVAARRSAEIEKSLELAKVSAAEECDRVRGLAETAASIPVIRSPEYITRLAHYEVTPGEIGMLPFLALAVVAACFFVYVGLATAVGVSEIAGKDSAAKSAGGGDGSGQAEKDSDPTDSSSEPAPTYAEECEAIPNPLDLGHGLGELFRRDGAFKAGCGTKPHRVQNTATWVSAGICDGTIRSVAIASAGGPSAIVYGEVARFAWTEALKGNLLSAESEISGGGEVDLLETPGGTHVFTRLNADEGNDDPRSCTEVTGTNRPFVQLGPQMALLWLQLLEYRASWAWPTAEDGRDEEAVAFTVSATSEVTAHGSCLREVNCELFVDGHRWPGSGTSYVTLDDLLPYMP